MYPRISILIYLMAVCSAHMVKADAGLYTESVAKGIIAKLFSDFSENKPMRPRETFELLTKLDTDSNDLLPEEKKLVSNLMEASRVSDLKCDLKHFQFYEQLLKENSARPNIVSFLKHYRLQQFRLCKTEIVDRMLEIIDKLSGEDQSLVDKFLSQAVKYGNPDKFLKHGIYSLMRHRIRLDKKVLTDEAAFEKEFSSSMESYCKLSRDPLISEIASIFKLVFNGDNVDNMDSRLHDLSEMKESSYPWILYSQICSQYYSDTKKCASQARQIFMKRQTLGSKTARVYGPLWSG